VSLSKLVAVDQAFLKVLQWFSYQWFLQKMGRLRWNPNEREFLLLQARSLNLVICRSLMLLQI